MSAENPSREELLRQVADLRRRVADLEGSARGIRSQVPPRILELIFESMTDGVAGFDEGGRILFANPGMGIMSGRAVEDLVGFTALQAWGEESQAGLTEMRGTTAEFELVRPDGSRRIVSRKVFGLTSSPPMDIAIYRDITRSKRAQIVVQQKEAFYRQISEHAPVLFFVLDRTGSVRYVSMGIERQLGLHESLVTGHPMMDLLSDASRDEFLRHFLASLSRPGEVHSLPDIEFTGERGERRSYDGTIRNQIGQVPIDGVVVSLRDTTRERSLELEVQREQQLIAAAFDNSLVSVLAVERGGKVTFANAAARALFADHELDLLGRVPPAPEWNLLSLDGTPLAADQAPFRRVMDSGAALAGLRCLVAGRDGRSKAVVISAAPMRDVHARVAGVVLTILDVTEHLAAEAELAHERSRLALLNSIGESVGLGHRFDDIVAATLERAHAAYPESRVTFARIDERGVMLIDACRGPASMAPYPSSQLDLSGIPAYWHALQSESVVVVEDVERDPRFPDPSFLVEADARAFLDMPIHVDGLLIGVLCFDSDRPRHWNEREKRTLREVADYLGVLLRASMLKEGTERAEAHQRESERRHSELVSSMHDAVFSLDREGRITALNPAFERITGRPVAESLGLTYIDLILPADHAAARAAFARCVGGQAAVFEARALSIGSEPRIIEISAFPLREDGRFRGVSGIARDITERRNFEDRMREAQKLESLGILAGGIAHDFNNLLSGVLGNASLVAADLPAGSPLASPVEQIQLAALRMADLSRQMLAYAGQGRVDVRTFDMVALVDEMEDLFRASIGKRIRLSIQHTGGRAPVEADRVQMRQVLVNLVTNAAEAIGNERSGTIGIRTGIVTPTPRELSGVPWGAEMPGGPYVSIEVTDDGEGISEEAQKRVFEPFYSTRFVGRGLGLAAVQGIVRTHRGAITLTSELGRGTSFRVLLPAVAGVLDEEDAEISTIGSTPTPHPPVQGRGEIGILLVDDEEVVRRVTGSVLMRFGYRVLLARDGSEALSIFRQRRQDVNVVLLDLSMPGPSCEDVVGAIRAVDESIQFVVMSGYSTQDMKARFASHGVRCFLSKPFRTKDLLECVAEAVARSIPALPPRAEG